MVISKRYFLWVRIPMIIVLSFNLVMSWGVLPPSRVHLLGGWIYLIAIGLIFLRIMRTERGEKDEAGQ